MRRAFFYIIYYFGIIAMIVGSSFLKNIFYRSVIRNIAAFLQIISKVKTIFLHKLRRSYAFQSYFIKQTVRNIFVK